MIAVAITVPVLAVVFLIYVGAFLHGYARGEAAARAALSPRRGAGGRFVRGAARCEN